MRRLVTLRTVWSSIFVFAVIHIYAQIPVVEFDKTVHDFGDISIKSGKHSHTFNFKNAGKMPVVIQTVISSCGCTVPEWTKSPVMPGKSGEIKVTFLNDQGPYPFDKSLTVYLTGLNKPIVLRLKGVVHQKPKSLKELFPERFGDAGFRTMFINIDNIAQGDLKTEVVEVANLSSKPFDISFKSLSKGLSITANPAKVVPGGKSQVIITVNTGDEVNWGETEYNAQVLINGKVISGKNLKIIAYIRDNFANLTKEEVDSAPLPMIDNSTYDFGSTKIGSIVTATFKIRNLGKRVWVIHKIETGNIYVKAEHPKQIAPGATAEIKIRIENLKDSGKKSYILSLISNSPIRPVIKMAVVGDVTIN